MKNTVLKFGLIGGILLGIMMFVTMPLYKSGTLNMDNGQWVGYTTMVISLSFVYFGVRSYRQNLAGGTLTFGKAFGVAFLIALVTSLVYCLSWEICYRTIASDFTSMYSEQYLAHLKNNGATEEMMLAKQQEMASFTEMYKNPIIRFGFTLMEILPVGLIMSLVSAFVLKKKAGA